jgi:arylsulfatase A-like enzyme
VIRQRLVASALALTVLACGGEPRQRLVLITLDTLRHDSLAGRGKEAGMPRLSELGARGLVFENFFSATSSTQPSHASLFTGLHPWKHGVVRNGCMLDERHATLAGLLRAEGFETAAAIGSYALHSSFGFARGFDRFDEEFSLEAGGDDAGWMGHTLEEGGFYSLADDTVDRALGQLERMTSARQFLWVHFYDPHTPYGDSTETPVDLGALRAQLRQKEPGWRKAVERARELYDRDVAALDRALGRLLERLDADASSITTHIVVVSDHGESFGEANSLGHGNRLTREQILVPCLIVSPAVKPGVRSDVAGTVDLHPTLLRLLGIEAPPTDGRDLLREPGDSAGSACGMSRLPAKGSVQEIQADGSVVVHHGARFYVVRDGLIYSGNGRETFMEDLFDIFPPPELDSELQALFAGYERELASGPIQPLDDAQAVEGLEKLGYGGE